MTPQGAHDYHVETHACPWTVGYGYEVVDEYGEAWAEQCGYRTEDEARAAGFAALDALEATP